MDTIETAASTLKVSTINIVPKELIPKDLSEKLNTYKFKFDFDEQTGELFFRYVPKKDFDKKYDEYLEKLISEKSDINKLSISYDIMQLVLNNFKYCDINILTVVGKICIECMNTIKDKNLPLSPEIFRFCLGSVREMGIVFKSWAETSRF